MNVALHKGKERVVKFWYLGSLITQKRERDGGARNILLALKLYLSMALLDMRKRGRRNSLEETVLYIFLRLLSDTLEGEAASHARWEKENIDRRQLCAKVYWANIFALCILISNSMRQDGLPNDKKKTMSELIGNRLWDPSACDQKDGANSTAKC